MYGPSRIGTLQKQLPLAVGQPIVASCSTALLAVKLHEEKSAKVIRGLFGASMKEKEPQRLKLPVYSTSPRLPPSWPRNPLKYFINDRPSTTDKNIRYFSFFSFVRVWWRLRI
jgi:hypothetical protein